MLLAKLHGDESKMVGAPKNAKNSPITKVPGIASRVKHELGQCKLGMEKKHGATLPGTHMVTWSSPAVCCGVHGLPYTGPGHPRNHVSSREC